jgi:outer membrane lipase/esterase
VSAVRFPSLDLWEQWQEYFLASIVLLGMALTNGALAEEQRTFDRLVVFGDSLSDMGNAGRYSNGPVWVEQLAASLKLPLKPSERGGLNFAVGGARVQIGPHSLREQVNRYITLGPPSGRTLCIVWGGANDIFAALGETEPISELDAASTALATVLADLIAQGATDLLVPNIPDVGITPAVRSQGNGAVAEAHGLTDRFNRAVGKRLADLSSSGSPRLYRLDVAAMAERARRNPASFGFTNISTPCYGSALCREYVFWDDIHPTTAAHAHLAEAALGSLSRPKN